MRNMQKPLFFNCPSFLKSAEVLKRLKRKEQECEKAKQNAQDTYELFQALMESFNILQDEKIKLEQEYEELKDKLNCRFCYPIMKIDDPENFKLCQETECFRRQLDKLKKELEQEKAWHKTSDEISKVNSEYTAKLKQTLAEIKEFCIDHTQLIHDAYPYLNIILDKINEVDNDKNNN